MGKQTIAQATAEGREGAWYISERMRTAWPKLRVRSRRIIRDEVRKANWRDYEEP